MKLGRGPQCDIWGQWLQRNDWCACLWLS